MRNLLFLMDVCDKSLKCHLCLHLPDMVILYCCQRVDFRETKLEKKFPLSGNSNFNL